MEHVTTTLTPVPPYDFDKTANHITYFRGYCGADRFHEGTFLRLLDLGTDLCLARVRSRGTVDSPSLELEITGTAVNDAVLSSARKQVSSILGIDQDLGPFYRMAREDPVLKVLISNLRGLHIPQTASLWEALVFAVIGQQVNAGLAHMLRTLFVESCGASLTESGTTYHAFPQPEAILEAGEAGLRAIKLGNKKSRFIVDIATAITSGTPSLAHLATLSDEEVIVSLTAMRGVGPWTAQWVLLRCLNRPDIFPHGDLALRRSLGLLLGRDAPLSPEEALAYSSRWSPHRSCVTAYIFAASRSGHLAGTDQ